MVVRQDIRDTGNASAGKPIASGATKGSWRARSPSYCDAIGSAASEPVKFPVPYPTEKGLPLGSRKSQNQPVGGLAIAHADDAAGQPGKLNAIGSRIAE
jgi:hypothetical protein